MNWQAIICCVLTGAGLLAAAPNAGATLITGTQGNDTLFFQGVLEQLTTTITNAYSGQVLSVSDLYNVNTATYDGLGGTDTLLLTNVRDFLTIRDGNGNQTLFSIENIVAGNGNDFVNLSDPTIVLGNTFINGGSGDDILWGNAGNDTIQGVDGNDNLNGGPGNDIVNGGNGNDTVDGGSGNDTVTGDAGDDTLIYTAGENVGATDNYNGGTGTDTLILRLTPAEAAAAAADIAAAQAFITANYNTNSSTGPSYTFSSFGLTFSNIEVLEVHIIGTLNIQMLGGSVALSWSDPGFSLQSAPAVTDVYTNVPGATSPYTNGITDPQRFFRLQSN
jgi:Ca2+-binding RTX toxin-like protein